MWIKITKFNIHMKFHHGPNNISWSNWCCLYGQQYALDLILAHGQAIDGCNTYSANNRA
jgi:hypothetical protein